MAQARYMKRKEIDIVIPKGKGTLIQKGIDMVLKEKAEREKERGLDEKAKPPNLLIFALFACIQKLRPCFVHTYNKQKKHKQQTSREITKEHRKHKAYNLANKQRKEDIQVRKEESMQKGKQACYQTNKQRKGVLEGQMWVWICVHRLIISEHRRHLCHQARFLKKDPGSHVQRRV